MATITKSYTENQGTGTAGTWAVTITGSNITVTGSSFTFTSPSVKLKHTKSGANKGSAEYFINNFKIGGIAVPTTSTFGEWIWTKGGSNFSYVTFTSGTEYTATKATKDLWGTAGEAHTKTLTTSTFFNSSNSTKKTLNITNAGWRATLWSGSSAGASNDNGYIGESTTGNLGTFATVTLNVPPTFTVGSISYDTAYIYAGRTTASVPVSALTAYYGGTISSAVLTIGSQTASRATDGTLSIALNQAGTFTPSVKVTDSRGQVTTKTLPEITVLPYVAPSVSFNTERTTATGTPDDEGAYAVIDPTFTFTEDLATLSAPTVEVTDEDNVTTTVSPTWYSSRASDGTLSGSVTWANLSSGDTVYGLVSITGGFNTQYSYQISITPEDSEGTGTTATQTLGSAFYTVDFLAGGHGIAFGQPASQAGFFCNMDATFNEDVYIDLPEYQTADTIDKSIYDAIVTLQWNSVMVSLALALKEWIDKVSNRLADLNGITTAKAYGVIAGNSVNIPLPDNARAVLPMGGASTSKGLLLANCSSAGQVTTRWVDQGSTNIVLSTSTNTLTITNNTSYGIRVLCIVFKA